MPFITAHSITSLSVKAPSFLNPATIPFAATVEPRDTIKADALASGRWATSTKGLAKRDM